MNDDAFLSWVTVVERCRYLRIEPDKRLTWSVGEIVATKWKETHGDQPRKCIRRKTNGPGSHCFAVYPPDWIEYIDETILSHDYEKSRQRELFS